MDQNVSRKMTKNKNHKSWAARSDKKKDLNLYLFTPPRAAAILGSGERSNRFLFFSCTKKYQKQTAKNADLLDRHKH